MSDAQQHLFDIAFGGLYAALLAAIFYGMYNIDKLIQLDRAPF